MRRSIILAVFLVIGVVCSYAQKHDFANWDRYHKANTELGLPAKGEKRVVLYGNSITDFWPDKRPEFFKENNLVGRGISGQTSYQFVLRFYEDVINLQPKVVVINYGTNDVAENTGAYNEDYTYNNVRMMCEAAKANKIKVILASCLPAKEFYWRMEVKGGMEKIRHLNERVKAYAKANKIPYVDYFSSMISEDGTQLRADLSPDGIHPNEKGYEIMESLLLPVIQRVR